MICLVALVVFAFLSIFSAKHRPLAKEAFRCVFLKTTFRKCDSGLDTRIKTSVSGKFFKIHPKAGRLVFKNFDVISFLFTILFFWSIIATGLAGYNFWIYGNCNGPDADGFCVFDPTGQNNGMSSLEEEGCTTPELLKNSLDLDIANKSMFLDFSAGEENTVYFFGCYACPFTRDAYPTLMKLADRDDTGLLFAHFPVKNHSQGLSEVVNCLYKEQPELVRPFNDRLFSTEVDELNLEAARTILSDIGAADTVLTCAQSDEARVFAEQQKTEIENVGIYGTPLVFINNESIVGPKPYRIYKRMLK